MSKSFNSSMAAKAGTTVLSKEELRRLLELSKAGDIEARNKILMANLGLIGQVAKKFYDNESYEDRFNDGCIRFLEIINNYDPDRASLSTYVQQAIWQYMNTEMYGEETSVNRFKSAYNKSVDFLSSHLNRNPSEEEIADFMGMSVSTLAKHMLEVYESAGVSLDKPMGDENQEFTLADTLSSNESVEPSYSVLKDAERKGFRSAFGELSDEERKTVFYRLQDDGTMITLRQAATETGCSHETIRQREKSARRHLMSALEKYGVIA